MAEKKYDTLNLLIVAVVALMVYIVLLKLMWDWYGKPDRSAPTMAPMVTVLVTGIVVGILAFVGYIILSHKDSEQKLICLVVWGITIDVMISAYVAYFSRDLKVEAGYLLLIMITLQAIMLMKMMKVNVYGTVALITSGLLSAFLYGSAIQNV